MKILYVIALALVASHVYGADLSRMRALDLQVPMEESTSPFFVDPSMSQQAESQYLNAVIQQIKKTAFAHWPVDETGAKLYGSGDLIITIRRDGSIEDIQALSASNPVGEPLSLLIKKMAPYAPFPQRLFPGHDAIAFKMPFDFPNKGGDKFKAPFKLKGNNQNIGVRTSVPF